MLTPPLEHPAPSPTLEPEQKAPSALKKNKNYKSVLQERQPGGHALDSAAVRPQSIPGSPAEDYDPLRTGTSRSTAASLHQGEIPDIFTTRHVSPLAREKRVQTAHHTASCVPQPVEACPASPLITALEESK